MSDGAHISTHTEIQDMGLNFELCINGLLFCVGEHAQRSAYKQLWVNLAGKVGHLDRFTLRVQCTKRFSSCLDTVKEEKDCEKEALSATGRFFVTTSKESPSQPSVVLLVIAV